MRWNCLQNRVTRFARDNNHRIIDNSEHKNDDAKNIFVPSEASDLISKTIQSHTPRASFASVIFPVK